MDTYKEMQERTNSNLEAKYSKSRAKYSDLERITEWLSTQEFDPFAKSLHLQIKTTGTLSPKQYRVAKKMFTAAKMRNDIALNAPQTRHRGPRRLENGIYYQPDTKTLWKLTSDPENKGGKQVCRIRHQEQTHWEIAKDGEKHLSALLAEGKASLMDYTRARVIGRATWICPLCTDILIGETEEKLGLHADCASKMQRRLDKSS